uniref:Aldehyde dehydrogenase n=1 Tax=feces metagenome TaxID=1861841 RepID=A0A7M2QMK0_9ZZZZ
MSKKTTPSYEAYCKCFAGVFRKHVHGDHRSFFTCYIRDAITRYVEATDELRDRMLERAVREDTIGAYIAKSLLSQGWPENYILEYADLQQEAVNDAEEYSGLEFVDALGAAGYENHGFYREGNGLRYAWLMDGSPDLTDRLDPADEYDDCDD